MNKSELVKALKYTEEKHKHNTTNTFGTNVSLMCADTLRVLKNCMEIPEGVTNGDVVKIMFPNIEVKKNIVYGLKNGIKATVHIDEHLVSDLWFPTSWWNAPYKKEAEE